MTRNCRLNALLKASRTSSRDGSGNSLTAPSEESTEATSSCGRWLMSEVDILLFMTAALQCENLERMRA